MDATENSNRINFVSGRMDRDLFSATTTLSNECDREDLSEIMNAVYDSNPALLGFKIDDDSMLIMVDTHSSDLMQEAILSVDAVLICTSQA